MEQKYLNPFISGQLKVIMERDNIQVKLNRQPGTDTYKVIDDNGKEIFSYINGWDYGMYFISVFGHTVAEIEWSENNGKPTKDQESVFEIGRLVANKYNEQQMLNKMSIADKHVFTLLKEYTNKTQKTK